MPAMTRKDRIISLAVEADRLRKLLADVEAELEQLISNKKRPKTKRPVVTLTREQREQVGTGSLAERIGKLLQITRGEPLAVPQISELVNADNPHSVRGVLSRLKAAGTVSNVGRGVYAAREPGSKE